MKSPLIMFQYCTCEAWPRLKYNMPSSCTASGQEIKVYSLNASNILTLEHMHMPKIQTHKKHYVIYQISDNQTEVKQCIIDSQVTSCARNFLFHAVIFWSILVFAYIHCNRSTVYFYLPIYIAAGVLAVYLYLPIYIATGVLHTCICLYTLQQAPNSKTFVHILRSRTLCYIHCCHNFTVSDATSRTLCFIHCCHNFSTRLFFWQLLQLKEVFIKAIFSSTNWCQLSKYFVILMIKCTIRENGQQRRDPSMFWIKLEINNII